MNRKIPNENVTEKDLKRIMKKANQTEEQAEIKKFIIIFVIVSIIVIGAYFFTKRFVKKTETTTPHQKQEITFDYSKIILGELLNRPYDEYYVLICSSKNPEFNYYNRLMQSYSSKENSIKIYLSDLDDSMNEKFYTKKETNPEAKSVEELKVGDLTLIKVKKGAIKKYIEDVDGIKQELGL